MNALQLETGGRPVANDDFKTLQDRDALLGLPALLAGLGPCVVSGCQLSQVGSQWNVAAGLVWDGQQLLDFPGRSNAPLPAMFVAGPVVVADERPYQTGGTKTTITSQVMTLVAAAVGTSNLVLTAAGAITFWQRVQERTREVGVVEYVTDTTGYDTTGLGVGPKRGWALCNGANGTADLRGQFVVGRDPSRSDYDTVGKSGGEEKHTLSLAEMPSHNHPSDNRITDTRTGGEAAFTAAWTSAPAANGKAMSARPAGGDQPHENRPPFYVLAVRQWVGLG